MRQIMVAAGTSRSDADLSEDELIARQAWRTKSPDLLENDGTPPCVVGEDGEPAPSQERVLGIFKAKIGCGQSSPHPARSHFPVARRVHHEIVRLINSAVATMDVSDSEDFHGVLDLIVRQGVRLEDLASRTGVSTGTVSRWVNGISTPVRVARMGIMAAALNALDDAAANGSIMPFRTFDGRGKILPVNRNPGVIPGRED